MEWPESLQENRMTEFFTLLGAQPLDIRISAGLMIFSIGLLLIPLVHTLAMEAWQLATQKS